MVWAAMISQVQRSAAAESRRRGRVQPRVSLSMRKVCSMSNRRRNACQHRSTSAGVAPVLDRHSQTGLFTPPEGRCSTVRRMAIPSMTGSGLSCSSQAGRWVSLGCSRSHAHDHTKAAPLSHQPSQANRPSTRLADKIVKKQAQSGRRPIVRLRVSGSAS